MARADRFLENSGVGGDTNYSILVQQTLKLARGELRAVNVVIPDALPQCFELKQWIGHQIYLLVLSPRGLHFVPQFVTLLPLIINTIGYLLLTHVYNTML